MSESTIKYDASRLYDVIVVGGGPAGLTAALYLARAKYRVLVLEKEQFGGQITITSEVVNYPGIERTSGKALTEAMLRQAEAFGAEFLLAEARGFELSGEVKTVKTDKGDFYCLGILLATGAHPRAVGFEGEERFKGRGVAYCATCDGEFFTDKEVFVVGGGFAAAEESVFLTKFARHVTVLVREDDFTCAAAVAEPAKRHEKITVVTNTVVESVSGDDSLNCIRYRNLNTNEITEYRAKGNDTIGVFVFVGYAPATELVRGSVDLNEHGYIITNSEQETNVEGMYAAGDVCIKPLRQVVTATGDGALAATELEKYVSTVHRRTGISVKPPKTKVAEQPKKEHGHEDTIKSGNLLSSDIHAQLSSTFERLKEEVILRLYLDERPISRELYEYMEELSSLSNKISVEIADRAASSDFAPCVEICLGNGVKTGLAFHGVPGGHEFTSFVLGIYNAAGPAQALDGELIESIKAINSPTDIKILVSLSCTMCPDTVVAAQHIAAKNPYVTAEVYDLRHFDTLKERYNVMSVPCIVINDSTVSFGKKNITQILELLR